MKLLQRKTVLETSSLVSSEDKGEKKVADGIDLYKWNAGLLGASP